MPSDLLKEEVLVVVAPEKERKKKDLGLYQ